MMDAMPYFDYEVYQKQGTSARIQWCNSANQQPTLFEKMESAMVTVNVQQITSPIITGFQQNKIKLIPECPQGYSRSSKFLRYHRNFHYIYFLIGQQQSNIWKFLKDLYQEVLGESQSLYNLVSSKSTEPLLFLNEFLKEGMQVILLIEKPFENAISLIQSLNSQNLLQIQIDSKIDIGKIKSYFKQREHTTNKNIKINIKYQNFTQQFQNTIKQQINKSAKIKQAYFNFCPISKCSNEITHRRRVIQQSLDPKSLEQYLQIIQKFIQFLKLYKNKKIQKTKQTQRLTQKDPMRLHVQLVRLQNQQEQHRIQEKKSLSFLKELINIKNKKQKGMDIQKDLQKLSLKVWSDEIIYQTIIDIYKSENSIYEILNNRIRTSFATNEKVISILAPIIKHLNQAIRYYFIKHRQEFRKKFMSFKQKKDESKKIKVYRGCYLSQEELANFETNKSKSEQNLHDVYLFNLGFMSTSLDLSKAKQFIPKNNLGYLLQIQLNQHFDDQDFIQNQQAFFCLPMLYKAKNQPEKLPEQQVLINPMNIFKVISVDRQNKIIKMEYAPQLSILNKIQSNKLTPEEKRKQQRLLSYLDMIHRRRYDEGENLRKKGQKEKALKYYQSIQQKESLTMNQIQTKVKILKDQKQFDKLEQELKKLINNCQMDKKQEINNLTKQSQLLCINQKFFNSTSKAKDANTKSDQKLDQLKSKKYTLEQVAEALEQKIKTQYQSARSMFETNQHIESLWNCYCAFFILDGYFELFKSRIYLDIQFAFKEASFKIKQKELSRYPEFVKFSGAVLLQSLPDITFVQKFGKLKNSKQKQTIKITAKFMNEYLQKRKKDSLSIFSQFKMLKAEESILKGHSNEIQRLKNLMYSYDSKVNFLSEYEKKLYNIATQILKSLKQNLTPTFQSLLFNIYGSQWQKYEDYVNLNPNQTEQIQQKTDFAKFLLDFGQLSNEKQKMKDIGIQILSKEQKKMMQNQELFKQFGIDLSSESLQIQETLLNHYKSNFCKDDIIQKLANIKMSQKQDPLRQQTKALIKTINGQKKKQKESLQKAKNLMNKIVQIKKKNKSTQNFHHTIENVNNKIEILNNSDGVSDNYEEDLRQANQQAEQFVQQFIKCQGSLSQKNEQLIEFYFLFAQTRLRRGFFVEAENTLNKGILIIEQIFRDDILKSRKIPLRCFRLKAQIVGIYGDLQSKTYLYTKLRTLAQTIQQISTPQVKIQINQAAAFVGVRIIPQTISNNLQQIENFANQSLKSLRRAISLRRQFFPDSFEDLVVDYTMLTFLWYRMIIKEIKITDEQQLDILVEEGLSVIKNIGQQMDLNPILHLFLMKIQSNYNRIQVQNKKKQYRTLDRTLNQIYSTNIKNFRRCQQELKGAQFSEDMTEAGKHLISINDRQHIQLGGFCYQTVYCSLIKLVEQNGVIEIVRFNFWDKEKVKITQTFQNHIYQINDQTRRELYNFPRQQWGGLFACFGSRRRSSRG